MGALAAVAHIGSRTAVATTFVAEPAALSWPVPMPGDALDSARALFEHVSPEADELVVDVDEEFVRVIVPSVANEPVRISTHQFSTFIPSGRAAIVVQAGRYRLDLRARCEVALIQLPRPLFQAWVSAGFAEPRRLRHPVTILGDAVDLLAAAQGGADALCQAVVDALKQGHPDRDVWRTVPSLKRATDYILDAVQGDCAPEAVADAAGMTLKTLRRQAQAVLGVSLSVFIRDARLTAARRCLATSRESRSIQMLARDFGFASGSVFARAYRQRFGESPVETRAQAVRRQQ